MITKITVTNDDGSTVDYFATAPATDVLEVETITIPLDTDIKIVAR